MKKILLAAIMLFSLSLTSCVKEGQLEGKCGTVSDIDYRLENGNFRYFVEVCFAVNCVWQEVSYETYMNARIGQRMCF